MVHHIIEQLRNHRQQLYVLENKNKELNQLTTIIKKKMRNQFEQKVEEEEIEEIKKEISLLKKGQQTQEDLVLQTKQKI